MAYKQKFGTIMIDRRFKGVGRIQKASGTDDPKIQAKMIAMLDELYSVGKLQILKEIKLGASKVMSVYSLYKQGKLHTSVTTTGFAPLSDVARYIDSPGHFAVSSRIGNKSLFKVFTDTFGTNHTVEAIPDLLGKFRDQCMRKNTRLRNFNQLRSLFQGYCTNTKGLGRHSQLWIAITQVKPIKIKARRKPALSVPQIMTLLKAINHEMYSRMIWTLVTTGMGRTEYASGKWLAETDRINIHGTKRESRDRVVPLVHQPTQAFTAMRRFVLKLRALRNSGNLGFDVSPHILRHTYAHWLESAGLPLSRRNLYMGHSGNTMDSIYTHVEVNQYLVSDAKTIRDWIAGQKGIAPP